METLNPGSRLSSERELAVTPYSKMGNTANKELVKHGLGL
jgi:hypothetical protein